MSFWSISPEPSVPWRCVNDLQNCLNEGYLLMKWWYSYDVILVHISWTQCPLDMRKWSAEPSQWGLPPDEFLCGCCYKGLIQSNEKMAQDLACLYLKVSFILAVVALGGVVWSASCGQMNGEKWKVRVFWPPQPTTNQTLPLAILFRIRVTWTCMLCC